MQTKSLVLEGATVLSGPGWIAQPDSSVLIEGDTIVSVGSSGAIANLSGSRVIDCRDRFLLPAYIDMHTHCHTTMAVDFLSQFGPRMEEPSHRDWFLKMLMAFGVTTVRDVGNFTEILDLKRTCAAGGSAPSMFVAGELLEGPEPLWPMSRKVMDEESVRQEVKRQKDLGVDWLKLYADLEPTVAETTIREAHSLGLHVAGHMGKTTARQAARMGIDTVEHATTLADEDFLSEDDSASLPSQPGGKFRRDRARMAWSRANLDSEAAKDLVAALSESRTAVCPTLVVHENTMVGPDKSFQNLAFDYVPQQWMETWDGRMALFRPPGEILPDPRQSFDKTLEMVSMLHSKGIRIVGGTDAALWNPYVVPGASVHREMELLSMAGLSPQAVLSSVTLLAADTLGVQKELGTIEPGKKADLVLLRKSPLVDIRNTREIELIVNKGRTLTPEDILESTNSVL